MPSPRKHNFIPSDYAVMGLESTDVVADIRADLIHDYKPVNSEELYVLERVAIARASLLRVTRLESGLHNALLNERSAPDGIPLTLPRPEVLADTIDVARQPEGRSRFDAKSKDLHLFLQLQSQTERLYRSALDELDRVLNLRSILPNEVLDDSDPKLR